MSNMTGKKKAPFRKLISSITAALTAAVMLTGNVPTADAAVDPGHTLSVKAHVQNLGWMEQDISYPPVFDLRTGKLIEGEVERDVEAGTTGRALRLESLEIGIGSIPKEMGGIMVNAHVSHIGWQGYKTAPCGSTVTVGTTGRGLAIEAIQIKLYGKIAELFSIQYKVHSAYIGWGSVRRDGQTAGTVGEGRRAEAIRIRMVPRKK